MFGLTPKKQKFKLVTTIADVPESRRNPIHTIVMHHTASAPDVTAETIEQWHIARGFSTIGYHFLVLRNGLIQVGRDVDKIPASVKGHNKGTVAFAVVGNFSIESCPTRLDPQARATGLLIAKLMSQYLDADFKFHRELTSTECPGNFLLKTVVESYAKFVRGQFMDWSDWYDGHVEAFDSLHPGFKYTSEVQ